MAFANRDFTVLAYANGFTLWHYSSYDPGEQLVDAGYFDDAGMLVRPGDIIFATSLSEAKTFAVCVAKSDLRGVSIAPLAYPAPESNSRTAKTRRRA